MSSMYEVLMDLPLFQGVSHTKISELIEGDTGYCDACFSGNYPVEPPTEDIRGSFEP